MSANEPKRTFNRIHIGPPSNSITSGFKFNVAREQHFFLTENDYVRTIFIGYPGQHDYSRR
jgi:hypothetical protein